MSEENISNLADFIFEVGMLRKTPRSGYQFLGSGSENIAEHSFRTAILGYALAKRAGANPEHTAMMCLFHDLHEARTGDFNYINALYNTSDDRRALEDATRNTGMETVVLPLWDELEERESLESQLAHDADQLDLFFNLLQEKALGNVYAEEWLSSCRARLHSEEAKKLAESACETDPTHWWRKGHSESWWVHKNTKKNSSSK